MERIRLARARADQLVTRACEHARRALASNDRALSLVQKLREVRGQTRGD
jgi:hypothetical protein